METLLTNTIEVTRAAGAVIMKYYRDSFSVADKSPDNPVTDADIAADRLLHERLMALLPEGSCCLPIRAPPRAVPGCSEDASRLVYPADAKRLLTCSSQHGHALFEAMGVEKGGATQGTKVDARHSRHPGGVDGRRV